MLGEPSKTGKFNKSLNQEKVCMRKGPDMYSVLQSDVFQVSGTSTPIIPSHHVHYQTMSMTNGNKCFGKDWQGYQSYIMYSCLLVQVFSQKQLLYWHVAFFKKIGTHVSYLKSNFKDILNKFGHYSLWTTKYISNLFVHILAQNGCIFKNIISHIGTLNHRKIRREFLH